MIDDNKNKQYKVYVWVIIENIVTIIAASGLFILTHSAWSFLLLINLNFIKK